MSIEIVAWIGVLGWVHFWIEYHFGRVNKKFLDNAQKGWKEALDKQEELIHICQMQARLLEERDNDGEEWKR